MACAHVYAHVCMVYVCLCVYVHVYACWRQAEVVLYCMCMHPSMFCMCVRMCLHMPVGDKLRQAPVYVQVCMHVSANLSCMEICMYVSACVSQVIVKYVLACICMRVYACQGQDEVVLRSMFMYAHVHVCTYVW